MLLSGAAGGGKSRAAAEKMHAYMLKYPGATGVIMRKDRASANRSIVPFMRYTVQGNTGWGEDKKVDIVFDYKNGSQMWVLGMMGEQQREAVKSIGNKGGVDILWHEEATAFIEDDFNLTLTRMRGTACDWRQIILTTNPGPPSHWINQRLILGGNAKIFNSRPEDNPYNPPEYIETLKSLTGVYYDRLYLGLWVQAEGAIYNEFDGEKHLIDWNYLPPDDRYIVSIDFGYTNPFSCSLWHISSDSVPTLYKQIYVTGMTVEDLAPEIHKMTEGLHIEVWLTDHDAEDRATLEKHLGIKTKAAYKLVSPGIQAVKQRMKEGRIRFMRGALMWEDEALKRARRPLCTIDEIPNYRWSDRKQDTPIKEDDHGLDDMRYMIAYLDKIDRKSVIISPKATIGNYNRSIGDKDERIIY
jgi:phage terminase large subunit